MRKVLNWTLDGLMLVVPVLELSQIISFIPMEWLPVYMLVTVGLRRFARLIEEYLDGKLTQPDQ
jgi:hypothetical protein